MLGLDPMSAWDRTPGELLEYIRAGWERRRRRREELACLAYALGGHVNHCMAGKSDPIWVAFRGWVEMPEQSPEAMLEALEQM